MGSRIRFTKATQVFETYEELSERVTPATGDVSPQDYTLQLLESEDPHAAIAFFAHVLPKREAVWWGVKCVEGIDRGKDAQDKKILELAETWVREGDEEACSAVRDAAENAKGDSPSIWIGRAAGWSGGSLSPNPEFRVEMPPHLTAVGVNAAMQIAIGSLGPGEREEALKDCLSAGLSFAEGGVMPVVTIKTATAT